MNDIDMKGFDFCNTHTINLHEKIWGESDPGGSSETKLHYVAVSSPTRRRNDVVIGLSKHQA